MPNYKIRDSDTRRGFNRNEQTETVRQRESQTDKFRQVENGDMSQAGVSRTDREPGSQGAREPGSQGARERRSSPGR